MFRNLVAALAVLMLSTVPLAASAQLSPGTQLVGTINQDLSSNHAYVGERFTMSNVHSMDNNINGATIYGHVADVQKAGQGTPGKVLLAFDSLHTQSGNVYTLNARATNIGTVTKSNVAKEAGGALAGMIVGNVLGKAIGTNLGGLVGAAGGYMVAHNNRQNVDIPAGAPVTVQVLSARRQARH